jgi:hypothetical protein
MCSNGNFMDCNALHIGEVGRATIHLRYGPYYN